MYIAALDIGGTKTIAAVLDETGAVLKKETFPSVTESWREHFENCTLYMKAVMAQLGLTGGDVAGLGISLPGVADPETGTLVYAPYANWENVPAADWFRKSLGIGKVCCENDVNACAVGELKFGLGKKYSDFVWMTVSTGVGGAVVQNKALVRGAKGSAGELGHLKVEYQDPRRCPCGQYGCLEAHGSGTALIRETRELAAADEDFRKALEDAGLKADGGGCAALAAAGNAAALDILDRIGVSLGRGISYCLNILDPQAVIIGGGVARALDLLLPSIRRTIRQTAYPSVQEAEIVQTALGYEAALIGAAALVLENGGAVSGDRAHIRRKDRWKD